MTFPKRKLCGIYICGYVSGIFFLFAETVQHIFQFFLVGVQE